jgi:hypothetical protein
MAELDRLTVTLTNWGKHQRSDIKRPTWFALSNDLLDNEDLADFTPLEFHTLVYIFCQASKKNSDTVSLVFAHAEKRNISKELLLSVAKKLQLRSMLTTDVQLTFADVQISHATDRQTLQTNITDTQTHPPGSDEPTPEIQFFNLWNENCGELPQLRSLGNARKSKVKARLRETPDLEIWKAAIQRISKSDFCTGKGPTGWIAGFDWFIKPETLSKVLEGNYDTRKKSAVAVADVSSRIRQAITNISDGDVDGMQAFLGPDLWGVYRSAGGRSRLGRLNEYEFQQAIKTAIAACSNKGDQHG